MSTDIFITNNQKILSAFENNSKKLKVSSKPLNDDISLKVNGSNSCILSESFAFYYTAATDFVISWKFIATLY